MSSEKGWQLLRFKDARRTREFWTELRLTFKYPIQSKEFEELLSYYTYLNDMKKHVATALTRCGSSRFFEEENHSITRFQANRLHDGTVRCDMIIHADKPSQRLFPSKENLNNYGQYGAMEVCGRFGPLPDIPNDLLCQWMTENLGKQVANQTKQHRMSELRNAGSDPIREMVWYIQKRALENANFGDRLKALVAEYNYRCQTLSEDEEWLSDLRTRHSPDIMDLAELSFAKMHKWGTVDFEPVKFRSIPEEVLQEVATPLSERLLSLKKESSDE